MTRLSKLRESESELLRQLASVERAYVLTGGCRKELDKLERCLDSVRDSIARVLPPVEWELHCGVPTLVLRHVRGRTALCPYCGCCHCHGGPDGHRVAHCVSGASVRAADGTLLVASDGYILRRSTQCKLPSY